jgi:hypothetical protein
MAISGGPIKIGVRPSVLKYEIRPGSLLAVLKLKERPLTVPAALEVMKPDASDEVLS